MQRCNWPTWKKFLAERGWLSPACTLLGQNTALIPIGAQFLYFGLPIIKSAGVGGAYGDLLNLLADEDALRQFHAYLLDEKTEPEAAI